jgi:hypothetical protein
MLLTGAVPWNATRWPVLVLLMTLTGWSIALTVAVFAGAKRLNVPFAVAGAAVTVTAFSVDAALGGVMEPGSMLNSRPVNGGRWYGFGNVSQLRCLCRRYPRIGRLLSPPATGIRP